MDRGPTWGREKFLWDAKFNKVYLSANRKKRINPQRLITLKIITFTVSKGVLTNFLRKWGWGRK